MSRVTVYFYSFRYFSLTHVYFDQLPSTFDLTQIWLYLIHLNLIKGVLLKSWLFCSHENTTTVQNFNRVTKNSTAVENLSWLNSPRANCGHVYSPSRSPNQNFIFSIINSSPLCVTVNFCRGTLIIPMMRLRVI